MANDPLKKIKNRGQQFSHKNQNKVGITLYDIDFAMMEYMGEGLEVNYIIIINPINQELRLLNTRV